MAEKPIKGSEIIEDGALPSIITELKTLQTQLEKNDATLKTMAKSAKEVSKAMKFGGSKEMNEVIAKDKEMTAAAVNAEKVKRAQIATEKALFAAMEQKRKANERATKAIKDEGNAYKIQSKTLTDLINRYQNLAAQGRENGKVAKGMLAEIQKLDNGLKKIDATVGRHQRNVGNYTSALDNLRGVGMKVTNMLGQLGLAMGVGAAVNSFFTLNNELAKAEQTAKTLFDVSNEGAQKLAQEATKIAKVYGDDVNQVLKTANVLQEEFKMNEIDALKLIEASYEKGLNSSGELLQNTKEYSTQLRLAGLNAEQAMAFIAAANDKGVFSDKGVDAIKEATLSLREMTPPAVEALEAIGMSSTQIQSDIESGAKTYFQVIQEISAKTKEFGEGSQQAGMVLADIFKGAGEDAGQFIFTLDEINTDFSQIEDTTTEYQKAVNNLTKSWYDYLFGVNQSSGLTSKLTGVMNFLARNLTTILDLVVKVGKAFLIYKSAMVGATVVSKAQWAIEQVRTKGLASMVVQQNAVNNATEKGTGAVKIFGRTINAVPIAMLITGLITLASEMGLFKSETELAAEQLERLNKAVETNQTLVKNISTRGTQKQDAEALAFINQQRQFNNSELAIEIELVEKLKKENLELIKILESKLIPAEQAVAAAKKAKIEAEKPIYNKQGDLVDNTSVKNKAATEFAAAQARLNQLKTEINLLKQSGLNRTDLIKRAQELMNVYKEKEGVTGKLFESQEDLNNSYSSTSKELSEMAKLEAELQAIQLERSNLIIRQKGDESEITLELKKQEGFLINKIQYYKDLLAAKSEHEEDVRQLIDPDQYGWRGETDLIDLQEELNAEYDEIERKRLQDLEDAQRIADERIQLAQDLTDITTFLTDRRIDAIDREIEAEKRKYDESKQKIDEIIAMREMDSNSMAQSIAFEKAEQAKALAEQEKLQKKKQRLELFNTSVQMLNAQIAAGNGNPLAKTMSDISALMGFIRSIPGFYEGTETTVADSLGKQHLNTSKDGYIVRVDGSEKILNPEQSRLTGNLTTDQITNAAAMVYRGGLVGTNTTFTQVPVFDNREIVTELAEHRTLLKQLVNKPVTNTTLEQVGKVVKMVETVNKPHRNIVTVKQKRIS
jgi:hypothetical protein